MLVFPRHDRATGAAPLKDGNGSPYRALGGSSAAGSSPRTEACKASISSLALLSSLYSPCDISVFSSVDGGFLPQDVHVPACPCRQQAKPCLPFNVSSQLNLSDRQSTVKKSPTTQEARILPKVPVLFRRPALLILWSQTTVRMHFCAGEPLLRISPSRLSF